MEKDSIPANTEGDQQDHSLQQQAADTTDESQSSNDETPQFFEKEETQDEDTVDESDDALSQTQDEDSEDESNEESEDSNESDEEAGDDKELAKWAAKQNIELTTPTEIALAKRLRDTQKGFHEAKSESKQKYDKAVKETAGDDQLTADSLKLARMEFFMDNDGAKELEGDMYDIAVRTLEEGDQAGFNYYQTPQGWKALLKLAKAEKGTNTTEDSYKNGRKDERKNLAKKQQASATRPGAQRTAPESGNQMDKIEKMSQSEYAQFRRDNPNFRFF